MRFFAVKSILVRYSAGSYCSYENAAWPPLTLASPRLTAVEASHYCEKAAGYPEWRTA
jgi:hypothetical protein